MKLYQLRSTQNKKILFEGKFETFKDCVESAVLQKIPLPYIDLSHQNLTNANLDDAIMPHADFTQSNLSGANISEAYVSGARFTNASLYNTCFCDSNLAGSNFNGAFFGGTDIFGSIISRSQFSTLSAFSLDFTAARQITTASTSPRRGKSAACPARRSSFPASHANPLSSWMTLSKPETT